MPTAIPISGGPAAATILSIPATFIPDVTLGTNSPLVDSVSTVPIFSMCIASLYHLLEIRSRARAHLKSCRMHS